MRRSHSPAAYPLLALLFSAASCAWGADYFVAGTVVDSQSHIPLANTRVTLASTRGRDQKAEQLTKQNGAFSFPVSQPGKYELKIAKAGYPPQSYKQTPLTAFSSAIVVAEDQDTRHIIFEAHRGGAIAGQIKDEDGEPVGGAQVALFQPATFNGERMIVQRAKTHANAAGEFRFSSLPRGNYYVCAIGRPWFASSLMWFLRPPEPFVRSVAPQPDPADPADPADEPDEKPQEPPPPYSPDPAFRGTAFMTTFYPNAKIVEAASLVRVEAGTEARVPITLPLTVAVSVKGVIRMQGEVSGGQVILSKKIYNRYLTFQESWVGKDGAFQFTNVPAGAYEIVATSQVSSGPSSWHIRQEVEVGAADMEVQLTPPPLGSVSGRILFDSEPPSPTPRLFVTLRNDRGEGIRLEAAPDGSFSHSRLPGGRYEITAGSQGYIAAYVKGPAGERLPLSIDVMPGANANHEIVLTNAVSAIEGSVEHGGAPQIGAFVLLMPKNQSARWAYRFDQTDSDGSYTLRAIPEGDYFLIALSSSEDVVFRDDKVAAILIRAAKPVHVDAGKALDMTVDLVDVKTLNLPPL